MARIKAAYLGAAGVPTARINQIIADENFRRLAGLAQSNQVIGIIARQVQADLLAYITSSVTIMQTATTRAISKQLNAMISRAVANAYIEMNKKQARQLSRDVKEIVKLTIVQGSPQDILIARTTVAMGRKTFLLFPQTAVSDALLSVRYASLIIGRDLKPRLPYIVKGAMMETFITAWSGLTEDQFPTAYRTLIANIIATKLKVTVLGWTPTSWTMALDFEELFGDYTDLQEGYHYGALLMASGNRAAYGPYQRVTLPYHEGKLLRNPVTVRYQFWASIWKGKRFYSSFANAPGRYGSRPWRARKMVEAKSNALESYTKARNKALDAMAKDSDVNKRTGKHEFRTEEAFTKHQARLENLNRLKRNITTLSERESMPPLEIINPQGLKAETIMARTSYWASKNIAPVWLLLQYGQVRYVPVIPPKGVFERFRILLNERLSAEITTRYNTQFAKLAYNRQGNVVIPPDRPIAMPLPLGITESQRFIPKAGNKIYLMQGKKALEKALGNIQEAPVFAKNDPAVAARAAVAAREVLDMIRDYPIPPTPASSTIQDAGLYRQWTPKSGIGSGLMGNRAYMDQLRRTGATYMDKSAPDIPSTLNKGMVLQMMHERDIARTATRVRSAQLAVTRKRGAPWSKLKKRAVKYY